MDKHIEPPLSDDSKRIDPITNIFKINPYYANELLALVTALDSLGIDYSAQIERISSKASAAETLCSIVKNIMAYGLIVDAPIVDKLLCMTETEGFNQLLPFLHRNALLNQRTITALLEKPDRCFGAFLLCAKTLSKHALLNPDTIASLMQVEGDELLEIADSLLSLDEYGHITIAQVFALVKQHEVANEISSGLRVLCSRLESISEEHAWCVIRGERMARSIAGTLTSLQKAALDTPENCEAILRSTNYMRAIEILLYQLKINGGLTQENFNHIIQLAPYFSAPEMMQGLERHSMFNPLPLRRFDAVVSRLDTITPEMSTEERTAVLEECSIIICPTRARGGQMSGPDALCYRAPSI